MKSLEKVAQAVESQFHGEQTQTPMDKRRAAMLLKESLSPKASFTEPKLSDPVSHAIIRSLFSIKEDIRKIPDSSSYQLATTNSLAQSITSEIFATDTPFIKLMQNLSDLSPSLGLEQKDLISLNEDEVYGILVGLAKFANSTSSEKLASSGEIFFDMFGESLKKEFAQMEVFDQVQHNQIKALSTLVSR